jgi:hypothetical protein
MQTLENIAAILCICIFALAPVLTYCICTKERV